MKVTATKTKLPVGYKIEIELPISEFPKAGNSFQRLLLEARNALEMEMKGQIQLDRADAEIARLASIKATIIKKELPK